MSKTLESSLIRLDIRRLKREGSLVVGTFFTRRWVKKGQVFAQVNLAVGRINHNLAVWNHDWTEQQYLIRLDWTRCHLGGRRPWFICPECGRRCALLYSDEGSQFACRECLDLGYETQLLDKAWRELRRCHKIRDILRWNRSTEGTKPKGMHQTTFQRLVEEHNDHDRAGLVAMTKKLRLNCY